jgi:PAS domain S-box-containing protein
MPSTVSRAVIEVLLDRVSQGAATVSPEGRLTYLNQRLASMLGQARAQLVGKPLAELVAEPDRETLATALATGRDTAAQCRVALPRAHGGELQALLTFAPLGHGQASCLVTDLSMLGAIRDAVEALKRVPLDADGRRALAALERQSGRVLQPLNPAE